MSRVVRKDVLVALVLLVAGLAAVPSVSAWDELPATAASRTQVGLTIQTVWPAVGLASAGVDADAEVLVQVQSESDRDLHTQIAVSAREPNAYLHLLPGVWRLSTEGDGWWSSEVVVWLRGQASTATVELWPTGAVRGKLEGPEDTDVAKLELRFLNSVEGDGREPKPQEGSVDCQVRKGGIFICSPPAGHWNLRLRATGFAPHYLWGLGVPAGGVRQLGAIKVRRGAVVSGWAPACTNSASSCTARLVLQQAGPAITSQSAEALGQRALLGEIAPNGAFLFQGVAAGQYVLMLEKPGFVTTQVAPILVVENGVTEIREPVNLERPFELEVSVSPPLDPWGRKWELSLQELGPTGMNPRPVVHGDLIADGRWSQTGFGAGNYLVLLQGGGSTWYLREHALSSEESQVDIELDLVEVDGSLLLGREPLPNAQLRFGNILMISDEAGGFAGWLPRPGAWNVRIDSRAPRVFRYLEALDIEVPDAGPAQVDIVLEDSRIQGRVLDEAGQPVADADVTVVEHGRLGPVGLVSTNTEGEFELRGLTYGRHSLQAELQEAASLWTELHLQEGFEPPSVTLVVRPQKQLRGRVVNREGVFVPGAMIRASVPESEMAPMTMSGADGTFTLRVPEEASRLEIAMLPPGYSLSTTVVELGPNGGGRLGEEVVELLAQDLGGSLVLELAHSVGQPQSDLPMPRPALASLFFLDGQRLGMGELHQWARMQGVRPQSNSVLALPKMGYGFYQACLFPMEQVLGPEVLMPSAANCDSGYLAPGGELVLNPPSTAQRSYQD